MQSHIWNMFDIQNAGRLVASEVHVIYPQSLPTVTIQADGNLPLTDGNSVKNVFLYLSLLFSGSLLSLLLASSAVIN